MGGGGPRNREEKDDRQNCYKTVRSREKISTDKKLDDFLLIHPLNNNVVFLTVLTRENSTRILSSVEGGHSSHAFTFILSSQVLIKIGPHPLSLSLSLSHLSLSHMYISFSVSL